MSSKQPAFKKGDRVRLRTTGAVYELVSVNEDRAYGLYRGSGVGGLYADSSQYSGSGGYVPNESIAPLDSLKSDYYWEYAEDPFVRFVKDVLEIEAANGSDDICY